MICSGGHLPGAECRSQTRGALRDRKMHNLTIQKCRKRPDSHLKWLSHIALWKICFFSRLVSKSCENYKYAHACGNYCLATGAEDGGRALRGSVILRNFQTAVNVRVTEDAGCLKKWSLCEFFRFFYFFCSSREYWFTKKIWGKSVF